MSTRALLLGLAIGAAAACPGQEEGARTLPGMRPDGSMLLHNQWPIRPAGQQVAMGDFPVAVAVDRSGRLGAVLHAGHGAHEVRLVDLAAGRVVASAPIHEAFCGIAFSPDAKTLVCSGASDGVLHVFSVAGDGLSARADVRVDAPPHRSVVAGIALSRDGRSALAALAFDSRVVRVDLVSGSVAWTARVGGEDEAPAAPRPEADDASDPLRGRVLVSDADPLNIAWDEGAGRAYVTLWGEASVAVIDTADGRLLGRWPTGLHPNELVLSPDGRLFVSNGGLNSVTIMDARDGRVTEVLSSAASPGDLPGSTPDSLALSPDSRTLYVANEHTNTVAVFDVAERGGGRPLGFIPTGWFPSSVRVTPDAGTLLVLSARGLTAKPSWTGARWQKIDDLYEGSLGIIRLPPRGDDYARALAGWTATAQRCRPAPARGAAPGDPIPGRAGDPSPIRYVVYVIKENRTYDQVLGDLPQGNGDPTLCLFPERVTPNLHRLAREFVLLDNFYVDAEVSADGHEWSMAAYATDFVEKMWPLDYGHNGSKKFPYPSEGSFPIASPAGGYLWDSARQAGVSYRSYGEFVSFGASTNVPGKARLPALRGHIDEWYRGWDLAYPDVKRTAHFIAELKRFEAAGDMPRLQILRLPNDHTHGATSGQLTPRAYVGDNDLALGQLVEAVSRSKFWPQTAIFVVEDDAQNGPDHVDAHRTTAFVFSPYVRHGIVDSTMYSTTSMVRTIELILGLKPMSQFDAAATPMFNSFQAVPDLRPYDALPANVDLEERNSAHAWGGQIKMNFAREDAVDDLLLNEVVWRSVRGATSPMPAPVRAAFVFEHRGEKDED